MPAQRIRERRLRADGCRFLALERHEQTPRQTGSNWHRAKRSPSARIGALRDDSLALPVRSFPVGNLGLVFFGQLNEPSCGIRIVDPRSQASVTDGISQKVVIAVLGSGDGAAVFSKARRFDGGRDPDDWAIDVTDLD